MKSFDVREIRTILSGKLLYGSDETIVHHGAYRFKHINKKHTIFFSKKRIVNFNHLKEFFPLVIVTHRNINMSMQTEGVTIIQVEDTDKAYWKFVHYYRSLFNLPVVAITGTSGKTTTKEMIKHILSVDKNITGTGITSNSRTAHLQYLLNIDEDTEAGVFETAVGSPGDVLLACEYYKPSIGIITNIGEHHLNRCKSPEEYIKAKGEMVAALKNQGVLILNAEDENSKKIDLQHYQGRIIKVGKADSSDFIAKNIQYSNDGMEFTLKFNQKEYPSYVHGYGEHQVYNALSAIAAVNEIGIDPTEAVQRLKTFRKFNKQLQVLDGLNGSTILDDTWSSTTTSLEAALKVLDEIGKGRKKIAIIGTITDVGSWGYYIHQKAGEIVNNHDVDVLITIGMHAKIIADHAVKCGFKSKVYTFNNSILVYNLLSKIIDKNTIVLIKSDMYSKAIIELVARIKVKEKAKNVQLTNDKHIAE
ncbi:Mur ligase family protein [Lederbergia wuyishanensis]|uniref:UDP-N-acetylmuramoyl-tripeptide--D-alanyl-D-alanine ligase n=1 Tax=Lederbergia wuyishanensis TaxID=1347903 RepID=A0ABU0D5C6_9BACI|nr:Mur ligase family protein [Lederbergia wuyishanensis]MCJ8009853.1 Mur ligase family protein [Lederbergia wuyishanensis]MDQ0343610.1 UDP-N-acetylmuramoyl-tripeptide--D-alanyl-D-alanine ligase [Lederbergia wuyishanensis]